MITTDRYDERVLICAPVGRDAALARETVSEAGIAAEICADVEHLCRELAAGAAALVLTQEALFPTAVERFLDALSAQPSWSDLPVVVLVSGGPSTASNTRLVTHFASRAHVTFLERPVRATTLVSAVEMALRSRRRQYELRDLLVARMQAEEAERQARAEAERAVHIRDQFLASVAHDLKNPLGTIKGYAQLLQRRIAGTDSGEAADLVRGLARIDAMVTRAVGQIDELLDLARLQANQALALNLAPTDLVSLARTVAEEYQDAGTRHEITVRAAIRELSGVWDGPRLERVLGNLLANAIKYSPAGGQIAVAVKREECGPAIWAVLSVRDRGIGIPAADLPHLFQPFYRASNAVGRLRGTGLGLAGARYIVEQHGGTISVESQEGGGSTFTVRLPIVRASQGPAR
jgi:signal transduction histidine kinase